MTARAQDLTLRLTEAQYQRRIIDRATARGWHVHHCRPGRTSRGWATPITGAPGFSDLVLARAGIVHYAEVKTEKGRLTAPQAGWLASLSGTTAEEWLSGDLESVETLTGTVSVWRPRHWAEVAAVLDAQGGNP